MLDACKDAGITIIDNIPLSGTSKGFYLHARKMILLDPRLTSRDRACTLLHEYEHYLRGDDGQQSAKVEEIINRKVAKMVISSEAFECALRTVGCDASLIASELMLPIWVIQAYILEIERTKRK